MLARSLAAAAISFLLLASPSRAQEQGTLEPEPLDAPQMGLKINLPKDAAVDREKLAGELTIAATDSNHPPRWSLRIHRLHTASPNPSAEAEIEAQLAQARLAEVPLAVLTNEPFIVGDTLGHLCWAIQTIAEGQELAFGTLVVPSGPGSMLVFTVFTDPIHLASTKPLLESAFETISLRDIVEIASEDSARMNRGRDLLRALQATDVKLLVGSQQWYRIHFPPGHERYPTGREIGFLSVDVRVGQRGEVRPERDPSRWSQDERAEGLLVEVRGRIIEDASAKRFYDSRSLYWMAWDQSEELWNIVGTRRQQEYTTSTAESGIRLQSLKARLDDPRPSIIVTRGGERDLVNDRFEWPQPDVYLSQALAWVLPRLLPTSILEPVEFGWYFYNYDGVKPRITKRTDEWAPTETGYTLTTRVDSTSEPTISIVDKQGNITRQTRPDGALFEPTSLEELRRVWQSKGLPIGQGR